jgi:hypothetical protein
MKKSPSPRGATRLPESLLRQVNLYALGATATGVGFLTLAKPAEAKVIYTPTHQQIFNDIFIDINHDGVNDFACTLFYNYASGASSRYLHVAPRSNNQVVGHKSIASALKAGAHIGPKAQFVAGTDLMGRRSHTQYQGPWLNGGEGVKDRYLGLRFFIHGKAHYGWARITVTPGKFFQATLTGYAYETVANRPLDAGQKKESIGAQAPTLGHLARGASAIPSWRVQQTAVTTR